jgi:hypothetical protein
MIPNYYGTKTGEKQGGVHHNTDPICGVYENYLGDIHLIKRDAKHTERDIAEFLTAKMFEAISPSGCIINLVKNKNDPTKTYLASKFFKEDYKDLSHAMGEGKRGKVLRAKEATLFRLPRMNSVTRELSKKEYQDSYADAMVPSILFEDKSVHSGNIGVNNNKLVRLDFGSALRPQGKLESIVNPYKDVRESSGLFSKNYLLKDHPKENTLEESFIKKLKETSEFKFGPTINHAWEEITNKFQEGEIKKFGKQIAPDENFTEGVSFRKDLLKEYFKNIIQERQTSLKDMATQLELVNSLKAPEAERGNITRRIQEDNPNYFQRLESGEKLLVQVHPAYKKELAEAEAFTISLPRVSQSIESSNKKPKITLTAEQKEELIKALEILVPDTESGLVSKSKKPQQRSGSDLVSQYQKLRSQRSQSI